MFFGESEKRPVAILLPEYILIIINIKVESLFGDACTCMPCMFLRVIHVVIAQVPVDSKGEARKWEVHRPISHCH